MRAVITTTINVPHNLKSWRRHMDDTDIVIVAGDEKTPHVEVEEFLSRLPGQNIYLDPKAQDTLYPRVSESIGWSCIQRRNLAVLKAMEFDPTTITTIDDDNFPVGDDWFLALDHVMHDRLIPVRSQESGWFNPGDLCVPPVTHRGYPLSQRHISGHRGIYHEYENTSIGIVASLWLGDPDIDAVERIVTNPWVVDVVDNVVLASGTWAPFNSQATTVVGELAPLLFMWPGVGRYDDIWASYLARAVMDVRGWYVAYGDPVVKQARNEHNLVQDLKNEIFGMEHNQSVIDILRRPFAPEVIDSSAGINHLMRELFNRFTNIDWLPVQTKHAYAAWYTAVSEIERARYATA